VNGVFESRRKVREGSRSGGISHKPVTRLVQAGQCEESLIMILHMVDTSGVRFAAPLSDDIEISFKHLNKLWIDEIKYLNIRSREIDALLGMCRKKEDEAKRRELVENNGV
jgi:hypothetical protein